MSNYNFESIFEILGPEMIGPSSSHTAGACRIGLICRSILNMPVEKVKIELFNSFAETGKGHGTDKAILAGILGLAKNDENIKKSFELAEEKKIKFSIKSYNKSNSYHPNTAVIELSSGKTSIKIKTSSLGGGLVLINSIDGFEVNITGEYETLIVTHKDKLGILAYILEKLAEYKMNIVSIDSIRHNKIEDIKTVINCDDFITNKLSEDLKKNKVIKRVRIIHKLKEIW